MLHLIGEDASPSAEPPRYACGVSTYPHRPKGHLPGGTVASRQGKKFQSIPGLTRKVCAGLLALLCLLFLNCKKQDAAKPPPPSQTNSVMPAESKTLDSLSLVSIRFIQVLQSDDKKDYYTQTDCRCVQSTASFTPNGEMKFSVCDSIDSSSRYAIHRMDQNPNGMILYATHRDSADTIVIKGIQASPVIYEIRRSNYFEIESGNLFIDAKDSTKFEHHHWDCDEYQG